MRNTPTAGHPLGVIIPLTGVRILVSSDCIPQGVISSVAAAPKFSKTTVCNFASTVVEICDQAGQKSFIFKFAILLGYNYS